MSEYVEQLKTPFQLSSLSYDLFEAANQPEGILQNKDYRFDIMQSFFRPVKHAFQYDTHKNEVYRLSVIL